jgi:uncharacterized protein (DUF1684 family)
MISDPVSLADWRREVGALYHAVRGAADPRAGWDLWRRTRDRLFRSHAQSPLDAAGRPAFAGLPCFDYDPAARRIVGLVPLRDRPVERVLLEGDGQIELQPFARTRGLAGAFGGELTVFWIAGYGGGVFLPFADATSGAETYAGGRYLLDGIKGADLGMAGDRIVLDFNFAYHPSCVYSPAWNCPLAPAENRLPAAVRAGERLQPVAADFATRDRATA